MSHSRSVPVSGTVPVASEAASRIVVAVRETRAPGHVRRTLIVDGSKEIFFEISGVVLPPPVDLFDFAAVATFLFAMWEGRPLHIDGPVSNTLLRNLEELQEVWGMWRPSHYTPISITAEEVRDEHGETPQRVGVFAFSGGVDSTATLLRHHTGDLSRRAVSPLAAVITHGFDIPLPETAAFETARSAAEDMLAVLYVPLCVVRTNWKEVLCQRWEMEFGAAVASRVRRRWRAF